jgi:hypothetical protein
MRTILRPLFAVTVATSLPHALAHAGSPSSPTPQTRTYVSGLGSDNNSCTVSSPCKSFQAALALTITGGEIYVLDSADYGPVTINKAVTITSEGALAEVQASTGTAITINAGANDIVYLRGLSIDGGNSGVIGIKFTAGKSLNIQKSAIRSFTNSGISFTPTGASTLIVSDSVFSNNTGNGILVAASGSSAVSGAVNRVTASGNGVGVLASGTGANVTIIDTVESNNNYGVGGNSSSLMIRNSTLTNNTIGIASDNSAIARIGQSTLTANGIDWQATNGGQLQSYGNNNVNGNAVDGLATSTVALQ